MRIQLKEFGVILLCGAKPGGFGATHSARLSPSRHGATCASDLVSKLPDSLSLGYEFRVIRLAYAHRYELGFAKRYDMIALLTSSCAEGTS